MYPSGYPDRRQDRSKTDSELASFFAGTQARSFSELNLSAAQTLYVKFMRPVDIIIRRFSLFVNTGHIRCEIYRGSTESGTWTPGWSVFPRNETASRPPPAYVPQSQILTGGSFTGGTLYDLIDIQTSNSTSQQSTVGNNRDDVLGAPAGSAYYKFTNPGNGAANGIFSIWWEELP